MYNKYASEILYIAKCAAKLIMDYYTGEIEVTRKADQSPVTEADLAANEFIKLQLMALTPQIPIVSEENTEEENLQAASGNIFWMVDPLDGTKSYIKRTGEFTVNIALIENGKPTGGVVYLPAKDIGYFTAEDGKAYKQIGHNLPEEINVRAKPEAGIVVIASASHMNSETENYIKSLGKNINFIAAASSLKFCIIAEGNADIYPRFGNTMQWDTAAGQAVLVAAGGSVNSPDGTEFSYHKKGFLNSFFIARGR